MAPRKSEAPAQAPPSGDRLKPFVGHENVVDYFRRIGPQGLAHAYLFHGPRGVGKTTFARTLALTLHCECPTSFPTGYCGTCAACRRGLAGSSGDTIYVDEEFIRIADELAGKEERKTDTFGIETARLVVRRMQLRSYEGGRLICIIPNFENVPYGRDEVYNALLKELEEPDPGKIFLLTSERPERILATIRSRTSAVRFGGLSQSEIAGALVSQYGEKPDRAATLARRSQGSLGEAIAMRDDETAGLRDSARRWAIACLAKPGSLPPMPALGKDDPRSALDAVLRHARAALRDLMAYAVAGEDAVFDGEAVEAYRATVAALGPGAPLRAANALALFGEATRIAATNVPPSAVLGWLQIQLRSTSV
jgi:DNA polymerase-3 subunit delta'